MIGNRILICVLNIVLVYYIVDVIDIVKIVLYDLKILEVVRRFIIEKKIVRKDKTERKETVFDNVNVSFKIRI